jgi:hypothetical protein
MRPEKIYGNFKKLEKKINNLAQKRQILTNDMPFLKMADSSEAVFHVYET